METDANKTEENNVKKTEEDNAVPKITSVIKPKMKMVVQYCQTYTDREHGKILTYGSYGPYELKMASRIVRTVRFVKRIYRS